MIINFKLIGFVLLQLLLSIFTSSSNCPVSDRIDTSLTNVANYPINFNFDISPSFMNGSEKLVSWKCGYANINEAQCGPILCPVEDNNVQVAYGATKWKSHAPQLCDLKVGNMTGNYQSNIIFLGGSMTLASGTSGGCCVSKDDPKFNKQIGCPKEYYSCGWAWQFIIWVEKAFSNVDVHSHMFAKHGYSSSTMAEFFVDILHKAGIQQLTSRDIVFIDHSCNDDIEIMDDAVVKQGLEGLIRTIYSVANASLPNIIIIEQYPRDTYVSKRTGKPTKSYSTIYQHVARHYQLPLWSYRQVVHSEHMRQSQAQLADTIELYQGLHPPWPIHLFIADILAKCLLTALDQCDDTHSPAAAPRTVASLPPLLYDIKKLESQMCSANYPIILDACSDSTVRPENLSEFESSLSGWTEYIDHHDVPGWIINNKSNPDKRVLSFHLSDTSDIQSQLVKIQYLRTYENAGRAVVKLCEQTLSRNYAGTKGKPVVIDALFRNYATHRISIPQLVTANPHQDSFARACNSLPEDKRMLDIHYIPSEDHKEVRGSQKVKIISVQICRANHYATPSNS